MLTIHGSIGFLTLIPVYVLSQMLVALMYTICYNRFMKINTSIKKLGLTENEINVYSYLLHNGESSGKKIFRSLSMDKAASYRAIKKLKRLKLAYSIGENRNQVFGASDPSILQELVLQKKDEIDEIEKDVDFFIENIQEFVKGTYKTKNIQVYEGNEGFKLWSEERLYKPNSLIRDLNFQPSISKYFDQYDNYIAEYVKRRIEKGIKMRYLYAKEEKGNLAITNKKILKESRKLKNHISIPASISTFGDRCGFYTSDRGKFIGVLIKDPIITQLFTFVFDQLWDQAEPQKKTKLNK